MTNDNKKYRILQIFRPLISKKISQFFGDNLACVHKTTGKIFGTTNKCPSNSQSFYQSLGMKGHSGMDIPAIMGEEVYHSATFDGWIKNERDSEGGIGVDVVSNEPIFFPFPIPPELYQTATPHEQNGKFGFLHYVKMRYWHLKSGVGADKKQVTCGTVIGLAGNTGASSGTHLHFAPKWCNKDGKGVASNNGYTGAFDPNPYYNHNVTAKDHAKYMNVSVVPLSAIERKDINEQLDLAKRLLLKLRKFIV